jgi:tRNA pseudouridine38-40 synthase
VPRFKLTIEYAGTRYSGWQIQKNARTVQGEIDRAVRAVTGRSDFELYGSGRTDAGVHALAQVAHLDVSTNIPADTLRRRINDELPADINILAADQVPHRFHARHDAVARRYLYQIARRRTAFAKAFVWWVKEPLAPDRMRAAARDLLGMRDFKAFAESARGSREESESAPAASFREARRSAKASGGGAPRALSKVDTAIHRASDENMPEKSTIVLVERLDIVEEGELLLVSIEGSHFLWKMVRRIVGALVEFGQGNPMPADPARFTAPPSGLFLEKVFYKGDSRDVPVRAATPLVTAVGQESSRRRT